MAPNDPKKKKSEDEEDLPEDGSEIGGDKDAEEEDEVDWDTDDEEK